MPPSNSTKPRRAVVVQWRPTKIMNMRDLSKDDDFLSHLLVEKLGTGTVPLLVHKMDSSRKLPKTDARDLLQIVRRLVSSTRPLQHAIRDAVDILLQLQPIQYYIREYTQQQINAFATHASRYFELYNPQGVIEISHTSRYTHRTGKSELCILATRNLNPGSVITELKGSMANLSEEEDRELKRSNPNVSEIRKDFSVIHSKSMKKNHLFLGPARFVNHDCDNNCELFREGRYITFRVIKPIQIGQEITAHYGDGYFGKKNRHCLCETCERKGRGGYTPDNQNISDSDYDSGSDSDLSSSDSEAEAGPVNLDERRTRRGVYAVTKRNEKEDSPDDEDDDEEANGIVPLEHVVGIPTDGEIEFYGGSVSELISGPSTSWAGSNVNNLAPTIRSISTTPASTPRTEQSTPPRSYSNLPKTGSPLKSVIASKPQLSTPTPSNTPDSKSITPSASVTRRSTRISAKNAVDKASSASTASGSVSVSVTPTPRKSETGKHKEFTVKKEEMEPRILRGRLTTASHTTAMEPSAKQPIPVGEDGKPLPICATCSNILPLISVDSEVVWGLGLENLSKKKREQQQCPRCIRHLAIYGHPWPRRVGTGSGTYPTPQTDFFESISSHVTHKVLPDIDRKLARAAASASASASTSKSTKTSKLRPRDEEPESTSAKRRKIAKEDSNVAAPKVSTPSAAAHSPQELPKRKRGRPSLLELAARREREMAVVKEKEKEKQVVKAEELPVSLSFGQQPRNTNGRFDKKSDSAVPKKDSVAPPQKTRAERALERDKHRETLEHNGGDDDSGRAHKKARRDEHMEPLHRIRPRRTNFSRQLCGGNPSPLIFAQYAWKAPLLTDDESSEDDKGPETPDNVITPPPTLIVGETNEILDSHELLPKLLNPNPVRFAQRRWSSTVVYPPPSVPDESAILTTRPVLATTTDEDMSSDDDDDDESLYSDYEQASDFPVVSSATFGPPIPRFPVNVNARPAQLITAGWDDDFSDSSV